jgi:hypothetical protein
MSYDRSRLASHGDLAILAGSTVIGLALGAMTSVADGFAGALGVATLLLSLTERHSDKDGPAGGGPRSLDEFPPARESDVECAEHDCDEGK